MEYKETKIISQEKLTADIMSLVVEWDKTDEVVPGQFANVYLNNPAKLLPRPISICDAKDGMLRMVYRVTGEGTGTDELSRYLSGDVIRITGPAGNGYPMEEIKQAANITLMGGGIGIPPMLYLAKSLGGRCTVVLGYRNSDTFLKEEFENTGAKVLIASDDGSVGTHGTVIDAAKAADLKTEVICGCGPKPMLKAIKSYASECGGRAFISLEERMACGVGACLGCVTDVTKEDPHFGVKRQRVCKDGPVFDAEMVSF